MATQVTASPIKIICANWTRVVFFHRPSHPLDCIRYTCPEGIHVDEALMKEPHACWWPLDSEAGVRLPCSEMNKERPLDYECELRPKSDAITVRFKLRNRTANAIKRVLLGMCLDFRQADSFYGLDLGRAYLSVGGKLKPVEQTDRRFSKTGNIMSYFLEGNAIPEKRTYEYGWGVSDDQPDEPFIAIESKDGKQVLATWWLRAQQFCFNVMPPHHGCIHADPVFSMGPSEETVMTGRIYLMDGSAKDAFARFYGEKSNPAL